MVSTKTLVPTASELLVAPLRLHKGERRTLTRNVINTERRTLDRHFVVRCWEELSEEESGHWSAGQNLAQWLRPCPSRHLASGWATWLREKFWWKGCLSLSFWTQSQVGLVGRWLEKCFNCAKRFGDSDHFLSFLSIFYFPSSSPPSFYLLFFYLLFSIQSHLQSLFICFSYTYSFCSAKRKTWKKEQCFLLNVFSCKHLRTFLLPFITQQCYLNVRFYCAVWRCSARMRMCSIVKKDLFVH